MDDQSAGAPTSVKVPERLTELREACLRRYGTREGFGWAPRRRVQFGYFLPSEMVRDAPRCAHCAEVSVARRGRRQGPPSRKSCLVRGAGRPVLYRGRRGSKQKRSAEPFRARPGASADRAIRSRPDLRHRFTPNGRRAPQRSPGDCARAAPSSAARRAGGRAHRQSLVAGQPGGASNPVQPDIIRIKKLFWGGPPEDTFPVQDPNEHTRGSPADV